MPWWSGLAPEVIRKLRRRYAGRTLEEIGIEAMQRPEYAAEFAQTGAKVHTDGSDLWPAQWEGREFPFILVPSRNAAAFRDLVVAIMLEAAGSEPDAAAVEPDLGGRPMPALSAAMAIKLYSDGATQYRVREDTKLSPRQAKRVWTWVESEAVWWEKVERRPRAAKGFRLVGTGEGDSAKLRLVRA